MMNRVELDLGEYRSVIPVPGLGFYKWDKPLPLTSDPGVLRVIWLGCGAAFASHQFQSNAIIIKGDTAVFFDLGSKATMKMMELGLSPLDVKHLIFSHSRADHIGSAEEVGLKGRYMATAIEAGKTVGFSDPAAFQKEYLRQMKLAKFRPRLYCPNDYTSYLWNMSLRGGMAYTEEVDFGGPKGEMQMGHFFNVVHPEKTYEAQGRDTWRFSVGKGKNKIDFMMFRTRHIPDAASSVDDSFFSAGLILDGHVMISGDTQFDPEIYETVGAGCDTVFHDVAKFPNVHPGYDQMKTLKPGHRARTLLYHSDDGLRPLVQDDESGTGYRLGGPDVVEDGFLGWAEPAPVAYEWR